jgi:hypothetical protein
MKMTIDQHRASPDVFSKATHAVARFSWQSRSNASGNLPRLEILDRFANVEWALASFA